MKINKFVTLLLMLSLAACSFEVEVGSLTTSAPTPTAGIITETSTLPPTAQSSPTAVITLPSPTLVLPTASQTSPPHPSPTPIPTRPTEQNVKIFLIALEDNGQSGLLIGCGDSAIPVTVTIPQTQGVLRAALEKLFSAKQQFYGESGLYNALYQSDIQVAGVTIDRGKAIIHLTGSILLGGTCDAPRLEAQIEQTALQFSTVNDVAVFVNDVPLEDVLSSK